MLIFQLILCSIFPCQILQSNEKGVGKLQNATAILQVSGKLNLLMNFNRVPLIVLGFFNFHFPIDFIGVSRGVIKGVSVLSKPAFNAADRDIRQENSEQMFSEQMFSAS